MSCGSGGIDTPKGLRSLVVPYGHCVAVIALANHRKCVCGGVLSVLAKYVFMQTFNSPMQPVEIIY